MFDFKILTYNLIVNYFETVILLCICEKMKNKIIVNDVERNSIIICPMENLIGKPLIQIFI